MNIGRFSGSGLPRVALKPSKEVGGFAPHLFGWFESPQGQPRPRKRQIFSQIPLRTFSFGGRGCAGAAGAPSDPAGPTHPGRMRGHALSNTETSQKGGGLRPPPFWKVSRPPGPPRPPKSTISGRSKNHILKLQVYAVEGSLKEHAGSGRPRAAGKPS